MNKMMWL